MHHPHGIFNRRADIGLDRLVFKRGDSTAVRHNDKIGGLSALESPDADSDDIKLCFRGTITPSSNMMDFTGASLIFPDVGKLSTPHGTVNLSLVMGKDQMVAKSWNCKKFCPALLVKQLKGEKAPKDTKDANAAGKKGTGKGNAAGTGAHMKTVALQLEEAVVTHDDVALKAFSLVGSIPKITPEIANASLPDRLFALTCPSLKRSLDGADDLSAKKLKSATSSLSSSLVGH